MEQIKDQITPILEYIRQLRESKHYSQDYLAYRLDIGQNAYSKLELGYSKLSVQRLIEIAAVLEVDVVELIEHRIDSQKVSTIDDLMELT
ncbi:helix-turn-helix transcriptional regulator [Mucilaginibacter sp. SMC90]|uniref:helix-turn-helix domain-containing protein n=1 Tax=Mucilaginibacter sp. SMC90 TaxID=2929803 RepID=UPI001FB4A3F8|nr:helix-turn-helix transcriptional regulator [Mucilaginibacter sp. SMC90]UOE49392.1 helix-turn-helix transcriptional regulator [Mucilaginibacter sp. SMC90]